MVVKKHCWRINLLQFVSLTALWLSDQKYSDVEDKEAIVLSAEKVLLPSVADFF